MFDRIELKERAKVSFRANYWKCVLVALILTFIGGGASSGGVNFELNISDNNINVSSPAELLPFTTLIGSIALVAVGISIIVSIFLLNPLRVGCMRFMRNNANGEAVLDDIGTGFKNYWPAVKTMFLSDLYILLWSLLLIVPGIVKSYSYRMVPYLVADHPEMSSNEILECSQAMMEGNRWEAFVLDLSFFGWNLLSGLTMGLVGLFYATPYQMQTNANLYLELSRTDRFEM